MSLASAEMLARRIRNRVREPTAAELHGLADGSLVLCACCGAIFPSEWSDEEARAEFERNFGRPPDPDNDDVVCDPCHQEMARHYGLTG